VTRPLWHGKKWAKTKALTQEIEEDYNMSNKEIQDKILEILETKAENA
jgi:hypothetical protein